MRKSYKTARAEIQNQIREWSHPTVGGEVPGMDGTVVAHSPARAWVRATEVAYSYGLVFDEPVPQTVTAELARIQQSGDLVAVANFRRLNAIELEEEGKASRKWQALARWRQEPSPEEAAEVARRQREAEEHERAIQRRAHEIIAEQDRARLEAALAQARQELSPEVVPMKRARGAGK